MSHRWFYYIVLEPPARELFYCMQPTAFIRPHRSCLFQLSHLPAFRRCLSIIWRETCLTMSTFKRTPQISVSLQSNQIIADKEESTMREKLIHYCMALSGCWWWWFLTNFPLVFSQLLGNVYLPVWSTGRGVTAVSEWRINLGPLHSFVNCSV